MIDSFREHRVDESCFAGTSGYGHDDKGRDTLDAIYADVFGAESAFVRHSISNGTHAITIALYGLLRPNDVMLAITGKPYDTLEQVVGINGEPGNGSLADFGVEYSQVDLLKSAFPYNLAYGTASTDSRSFSMSPSTAVESEESVETIASDLSINMSEMILFPRFSCQTLTPKS